MGSGSVGVYAVSLYRSDGLRTPNSGAVLIRGPWRASQRFRAPRGCVRLAAR
jgi:hypothetical protein